jgi:hypothetical protein
MTSTPPQLDVLVLGADGSAVEQLVPYATLASAAATTAALTAHTTSALQALVGGALRNVRILAPWRDGRALGGVVNRDALALSLPANPFSATVVRSPYAAEAGRVLYGTVVVLGQEGTGYTTLTARDLTNLRSALLAVGVAVRSG